MVNGLVLDQSTAENIAAWLDAQPNLPYGLATIGTLLTTESDIQIIIEEDD